MIYGIYAILSILLGLGIAQFVYCTKVKSCCTHRNSTPRFKDIHRGNDRWYARGIIECEDCDWKRATAIPLPASLTIGIDEMDKKQYYDAIRCGRKQ